jgi:hypothetical protein
MNRDLLQQALTVLKEWDALIKYQYCGSSEAMIDMQYAAWNTMDAIAALQTELAKPEQEIIYMDTGRQVSGIKNPWVGLTSEDWENLPNTGKQGCERDAEIFDWIEAKLKQKNT